MLAIGDTVRLLPNRTTRQTHCLDILVVKTIWLKWSDIDKASKNDYDKGQPYYLEVWIYSSAYTSNPS
jgi:hypothetical protein